MNIDISIDKMVYNGKRFHFPILYLRLYQNKTGVEKGKATLSECGYIIFVRWKLLGSRMKQITRIARIKDCRWSRRHGLGIGDSAEVGDCGKNEVLIRVILSSVIIRDPDSVFIRDQKGDK